MTVRVTAEPIDVGAVLAAVEDPACGAVAAFVGRVRRDRAGRATLVALDYEAQRPMAEAALAEIARGIEVAGVRCAIIHRTGRLAVGEVSVAIAVAAPHREEAFAACRRAIEEIKARLPVWKREELDSGEARWVAGVPL